MTAWGRTGNQQESQGGMRKPGCGVMNIFSLLIVVIISQVCTYVKSNQTVHFKNDSLLSVNYTSIKLFFLNATCASCLNAGLNSCLKRADWRFNHMKKQTLFLLNCAICGYILADAVVVFYV